ncbi:NFACT RNA binding domain-containing protein [Reichenbachiella sp. MALMAid0571]|uniref:NFACT RNA binding domain-containing protein n=1 Tax=Reichenbachiella sp. MALMAid0571 TaxID=3143939 RepID=UPI0032DFACDF
MHFNYYFLKALTGNIRTELDGKILTDCFSQNKDELVLIFNNHSEFTIKATFNNEISLLSFPKDFKRAKRNSVDLFSELKNKAVQQIIQYKNERSFSILFTKKYLLLFKLHGRRANIILFKNGSFQSMFKNNLINDKNIIPDKLSKYIDQSEKAILDSEFDLSGIFPTFDKNIKNYLYSNGFDRSTEDKFTLLQSLLYQLNRGIFYIRQDSKNYPLLSLLDNTDDNELYQTNSPIEACNRLASLYFHTYLLMREKELILKNIDKEIAKGENYILKSDEKLNSITESTKYDELANILMANLHLKQQHKNSIELFDFYRNQNIKIKLKPNLTLQANAEIFYRKSKNQQVEIDKIKQNILEKENRMMELNSLKEKLLDIQNLKTLRKESLPFAGKSAKEEKPLAKPYIHFQIDGFTVLVGKSAKSNDELLRHYTSKDDLWLHARNVSGSHVIIKCDNATNIAPTTLEKVAQIAAWYSKGKNDTLCPVIHTRRKYVNKPKGAAPGKVTLQREEVIMVNPCQNPQ